MPKELPLNQSFLRIAKTVQKECFWDYQLNAEEIINMAQGSNAAEKSFLFGKMIENSVDVLESLQIFPPADRKKLIQSYRVSRFNQSFFSRRHRILQFLILGEKVKIPELDWIL